MDKNKIKSFAVWARRNLIGAVTDRAFKIGIEENNIQEVEIVQGGFKLKGKEEIFNLPVNDRNTLVNQIKEKGFQQVMEEAAYTWFNRFMGLRYMEVNEYLPTGIRVLSSEVEGKTEPDVLTRVSEVIDELSLNSEYIYELLDSGKTEDREASYKYILVKQCNELGKIIPQMFEKISDYTELLLPDNLLEEGSVIRRMVEDIEEDDWKEEVEIIGWMYQYYISEKKDEVFAALKNNVKITKENIPAATQLFTPKWIVKYMVENSLGRLWLEGHPNEELQSEWKYYLEEAEQEPEVEEELKKIREEHSKLKPEDIKVLDPCMGSGHILVYAFDVLYEIYKTSGYSEREIPRMILQNNLYGLDIDDRASQLASFALIMKARHYNRRLFREIERESLDLNLCSIQESNSINKEVIDYFCSLETGLDNDKLKNDLEYLYATFEDAKEYGSILEVEEVNFEALKQRVNEIYQEDNLVFGDYRKVLLDKFPKIIKQAGIMSRKYEICVTNPPYMSSSGMQTNLLEFAKSNYPCSKNDMFAMFIEKCKEFVKKNCCYSMITQHAFMFLSGYENLRKKLMESTTINMAHLGARAFDEIGGEIVQTTSFVNRNIVIKNYNGLYVRLVNYVGEALKRNKFLDKKDIYISKQEKFKQIPGNLYTYWISEKAAEVFHKEKTIKEILEPKQGTSTGNDDKYIRFWHEIDYTFFSDKMDSLENAINCLNKKYFPIDKGGTFRKWYGNNEKVIKMNNESYNELLKLGNHLPSRKYYFKEGLTWSKISNKLSVRYDPIGFVFSSVGLKGFPKQKDILSVLAFMNSKVCEFYSGILSPGLSIVSGEIEKLPYKELDNLTEIEQYASKCIELSRSDWNSFEVSWNFKHHIFIRHRNEWNMPTLLRNLYNEFEKECEEKIECIQKNEEKINKIFIKTYGLEKEIDSYVNIDEVTLSKANRERDIKSFISYAVGCILGRYSIDTEGLIYAGGDFKDKWNLSEGKVRKIEKDEEGNIISDSWVDSSFLPDGDNVIPITEDEYFEDDIVARFIQFVRMVYGEETLEENLDFIADSISRKPSETARQAIRRYFLKDFYKDHLKVYQKRPIYWLFESGKNDGFKALIYMHRYNEQTIAKVRTDYLHILQRKYEAEIDRLQLVVNSEEYTARDRSAAKKKIDRISKQIEECREYDQVVAHLANEKISIDLDDGVKVNYAKFQGVKVINSKGKEVKMDLLAKI